MDYSKEQLEEKMKSLPDDLQKAMMSLDITAKLESIADKNGLLFDQLSELADLTALVMLGLIPTKNFVHELSKRANINAAKAIEVAKDVNAQIFDTIRESLRKIESDEEASQNTDLQKAGGINVDKNLASEDVLSANTKPSVNVISKAATLNAIENPPAFIDRLLTGPSSSINETVIKSQPTAVPTSAAKPISAAPTAPKIDPYREPIE